MTSNLPRDREGRRARELKGYVLLYLAAADAAIGRAAESSLADLVAVLDSVSFQTKEVSPYRKEVAGYSSRRDALWIRPNLLSEGNEPQKLFDADHPIFGRVQYGANQFLGSIELSWDAPHFDVGASLRGDLLRAYKQILGRHFRSEAPYLGKLLIGHDPAIPEERGVVWMGVRPWPWMARQDQPGQAFWLRHDLDVYYCFDDPFELPYLKSKRRRIPDPESYLSVMPSRAFRQLQEFAVRDAIYCLADRHKIEEQELQVKGTYLEVLQPMNEKNTIAAVYLPGSEEPFRKHGGAPQAEDLEQVLERAFNSRKDGRSDLPSSAFVLCTGFKFKRVLGALPRVLRSVDRIEKCRIAVLDYTHLVAYAEYLPQGWWDIDGYEVPNVINRMKSPGVWGW